MANFLKIIYEYFFGKDEFRIQDSVFLRHDKYPWYIISFYKKYNQEWAIVKRKDQQYTYITKHVLTKRLKKKRDNK